MAVQCWWRYDGSSEDWLTVMCNKPVGSVHLHSTLYVVVPLVNQFIIDKTQLRGIGGKSKIEQTMFDRQPNGVSLRQKSHNSNTKNLTILSGGEKQEAVFLFHWTHRYTDRVEH